MCNRTYFYRYARASTYIYVCVMIVPIPRRRTVIAYGFKKSFSKSIRRPPVDHHPSKAAVRVRYVVAIIINRLDYNMRAMYKNIIIIITI